MANRRSIPPHIHRWSAPLGSPALVTVMTKLVTEQAAELLGSDVHLDRPKGVVRSSDGVTQIALGPLAARLAGLPATAWPSLIQREIQSWRSAIVAAREANTPANSATVRLVSGAPPLSALVRPAFGDDILWEIVADVGPVSVSVETDGPHDPDYWEDVAQATIRRNRSKWATMTLKAGHGLLVSGPSVTALLHNPTRLVDHLGGEFVGPGTALTTLSNDLMFVCRPHRRSDAGNRQLLETSLRRFVGGQRPSFSPFTTVVDTRSGRPVLDLVVSTVSPMTRR